MNWYKRAEKSFEEFVQGVVEEMIWFKNIGEIENIYDVMDRIKTDYRADTPPHIYEAMIKEVCKRLENELV